ncbi:molybdopterin molybdenumtransferase MoeA [Salinisphaera sp. Q1T1-3]|nr:molybdopterin molybdenumtransferase MoeA [Salinisphaera sp. Q1T1-3]
MPVDEARDRIIDTITPVAASAQIALPDALHRVLAEPVVATVNVPSATNASMDGYALAFEAESSTTACFELVGRSLAGHPSEATLRPGQCVRIMTGAVVPAGADAVVMQENTSVETDGRIAVSPCPARGENLRHAGEDIRAGDVVVPAGQYLRPADIALLASVGRARVAVYRRPRVAFFSTGDELRPIDGSLAVGEIYDSNRYGLAASLAELGMDGVNLGAIPDDRAALRTAFDKARDCDALITSGGVSVGEADHVVDLLGEYGDIDFWRVAIKPGKPLAYGRVGRALFFGLPGNPVSTAVTFIQLVRPALVKLAGGSPAAPVRTTLPTTTALTKRPGRAHYLRACINDATDSPGVTALGHQGSGVMHSMSRADAFIVLPADAANVPAGSEVVVEPFAQTIWGSPS